MFILLNGILKHVNGYKITKKLDSCKVYVRVSFWSKIKIYKGLCVTYHKDQPRHIVKLCENCPCLDFSGPYFPSFGLNEFSPNAGKYKPENLWIRTLFTQCYPNQYKRSTIKERVSRFSATSWTYLKLNSNTSQVSVSNVTTKND